MRRAEVTLCPAPGEQDLGTNTVIRVHSGVTIDAATVSPSSLRVLVEQTELPGRLDRDFYMLMVSRGESKRPCQ